MSQKNKTIMAAILLIALVVSFIIINSPSPNAQRKLTSDTQNDHIAKEDSYTEDAIEEGSDRIELPVQTLSVLGYESQYGPLPDSLRGTVLSLRFHVDDNGELIVTEAAKDIFDYFLSTVGEEPIETIIARIQEFIAFHLEEPARQRALETLAQYIEMKKALQHLEEGADELGLLTSEKGVDRMKAILEARRNVRQSNLDGEVYDAFYASEDQYDDATIARFQIMADKSLSEDERKQQLQAHEASLPDDIRESRARTQLHITLSEKTEQLKRSGATQEEIYQMRVESVGVEAAERLNVLDQQRAAWNERIAIYASQRDSILNQEGLSEEDKKLNIQTLRSSLFDEREQIRVNVLDVREGISL